MEYRFARTKFSQTENGLRVVIQSSGFASVPDASTDSLSTLINFRDTKEIVLWRTPGHDGATRPTSLDSLPPLEYPPIDLDASSNLTIATTFGDENGVAFGWFNRWTDESIEEITGARPNESRYDRLRDGWLDVTSCQCVDGSLFVTCDPDMLSYRDWFQDEISVFIVTPEEALDYIDIYMKCLGEYLRHPRYSIRGRQSYYFSRLCGLIPSFSRTWTVANIAEIEIPDGEAIRHHLQSFYLRLLRMLQVKDVIATQYYQTADNETLFSMLGELNTFMPLATGTFDSLAWISRHLYEYKTDSIKLGKDDPERHRTILRLPEPGKANGLVNSIELHNKPLAQMLRSRESQNLIGIYYPARDSIQHRHPLSGLKYIWMEDNGSGRPSDTDDEKAFGLAILDLETDDAISKLDSEDASDYFSMWRIRHTGHYSLLEPYKFVTRALLELGVFYESFFERLGLFNLPNLSQESKALESEVESKRRLRTSFSIPFLLKHQRPLRWTGKIEQVAKRESRS
jgi:hypothetical protein